MWLFLCAIILGIFIYINIIKPNQYWKNLKVLHIKPWPIVGNMAPFVFRQKPMGFLMLDFYNAHPDSRYEGTYVFTRPALMIKDPELIKQMFIKDFDHFVDHRTFITESIDPLFGKSLFSLRGNKWRRMRAILSPAFTGSKMRSIYKLISDAAEQFTDHFLKEIAPGETKTMEMKETLSRISADIIATTAFGLKCDSFKDENNEFYQMGKDAADFSGFKLLKFFGYDACPSLMKLFDIRVYDEKIGNYFKGLLKNTMETREKQGIIRPDMIHLLMEAKKGKLKHEDGPDESAGFATVEESQIGKKEVKQNELELNEEELTAQVLIFFIAGYGTITSVLSHTLYELSINEDIQRKLQVEIDQVLKECGGDIKKVTYEKILHMKYMDMVISEGLRKWPVVPALDRICIDSYVIEPKNPGESPVPLTANDFVGIPVIGLHRDPKYYPNPEKFDPERFSDENKNDIVPFSYLPFGVGPRNCIGSRFALLENKTLLFHILSKFNFVLVEKSEVPLKISKSDFSFAAENGFWLGMKQR